MEDAPPDLRAARKRLGLTQAALARRWGVPQSTISNWERGAHRLAHPLILADALRGIEAELLSGVDKNGQDRAPALPADGP